MAENSSTPPGARLPERNHGRAWTFGPAALLGAFGSVLLALASDLPGSPFGPHAAGLWPLAARGGAPGWEGPKIPSWAMVADQGPGVGPGRLLVTMAAVAGVALLGFAWLLVWRAGRDDADRVRHHLWWIVGAWVAPLLGAAPLASQDVWHYGAEGKMVLEGFGGYRPAAALGHSVWTLGVDAKWATRPSLYGPGGIDLSAFFVKISGGRPWVAAECWRVAALVGLLLAAWGVHRIVARRGGNTARAVLAGVVNPAVLVVLVGGIHNDALMLGLTVAGVALAVSGRPSWGLVVCALGVAVKPNALLAVGAVAWWAFGPGWRGRTRGVTTACATVGAILFVSGIGVGGGFGWIRSVTSYAWVAGPWSLAAQFFGARSGRSIDVVELAGTALAVALVLGVRRCGGWVVALGWGFAALAVTTPTPEPWYLAWAVVLLACGGLARRSERLGIVVLGAMMAGSLLPLGVLWWFEGVIGLGALGVLSLRSSLSAKSNGGGPAAAADGDDDLSPSDFSTALPVTAGRGHP